VIVGAARSIARHRLFRVLKTRTIMQKNRRCARLARGWHLAGALALPLLLTAGAMAQRQPAPATPPQPPAAIDGFREARFGMAEAALRQAIHKDFPKGRVAQAVQPIEKTTVLSLTAADLLPDTGAAQVSYILGYRSEQLIQINVVWSSDAKDAASDDAVVGTANQLRNYFAAENFPADKVAKNQKLGGDAILVLRASDPARHMVVLVLTDEAAGTRRSKHLQPPPLHLRLS
jgi:hypothetical protein